MTHAYTSAVWHLGWAESTVGGVLQTAGVQGGCRGAIFCMGGSAGCRGAGGAACGTNKPCPVC